MLPRGPEIGGIENRDRTFAISERALELMNLYCDSASPQSYELWFTYVTALKPHLNEAVKAKLQVGTRIGESELHELHTAHFATDRLAAQADATGLGIIAEIDQITNVINVAAGSAARYDASLQEIASGLKGGDESASLRDMIDALVGATREVAVANRALETCLRDSRSEVAHLRETLEHVRTETLVDALTGISNRRHFEETLVSAVVSAAKADEPLSLVVIDIDHFKRFNDLYGHLTGDQVLKLVALSMRETLRPRAVLARFGGEEFAMILPGASLAEALADAEGVRRSVEARELLKRSTNESLGRITVSLGVASLLPSDSANSLLDRADACMYAAKRAGRNRVEARADELAFRVPDAA